MICFFIKIYVKQKIAHTVHKIVQIIACCWKRQILAPFLSLLASAFDWKRQSQNLKNINGKILFGGEQITSNGISENDCSKNWVVKLHFYEKRIARSHTLSIRAAYESLTLVTCHFTAFHDKFHSDPTVGFPELSIKLNQKLLKSCGFVHFGRSMFIWCVNRETEANQSLSVNVQCHFHLKPSSSCKTSQN